MDKDASGGEAEDAPLLLPVALLLEESGGLPDAEWHRVDPSEGDRKVDALGEEEAVRDSALFEKLGDAVEVPLPLRERVETKESVGGGEKEGEPDSVESTNVGAGLLLGTLLGDTVAGALLEPQSDKDGFTLEDTEKDSAKEEVTCGEAVEESVVEKERVSENENLPEPVPAVLLEGVVV